MTQCVGARDAENWWLRAQKESCDLKKSSQVTGLLHGSFTGRCVSCERRAQRNRGAWGLSPQFIGS
jgi:hypothetical protein